ncbi:MAG: hypothetical protein Harvfovirus58_8 [Harvfovirus sp.]|uniref:Uncharacterized protein n=1 Tax=Harvfovirus sp. TaxID=2487768 RepID=A0A3G5A3J5_9VIRU|nr:MAG: hypothetical protein Harvfovirus58_8 [Harvfovirus sp.]
MSENCDVDDTTLDIEYILSELDVQIEKYLEDIDRLWNGVILEYKNNMHFGILLDKLNDREKFYELMIRNPTFVLLVNNRRKLGRLR